MNKICVPPPIKRHIRYFSHVEWSVHSLLEKSHVIPVTLTWTLCAMTAAAEAEMFHLAIFSHFHGACDGSNFGELLYLSHFLVSALSATLKQVSHIVCKSLN